MEEKYWRAAEQEAEKSSLYQARQDLSNTLGSGLGFAEFDMQRVRSAQSLCKEERLSRELLLNKLFKEGKSVSQNGFTLIYLHTPLPAYYPAQAGFSVPKRQFKHAHDRNRIKRLIREAYRKNKIALYQKLVDDKMQLALMIVYKGKEVPDYDTVVKQVTELLQKLLAKLSKA